ncbi:hypothetical protein J1605_008676 [Eschrichtius robustus]|uniref:Uncharacterized protein n=1 Tax=Eschrichtius robustus TaxID=9764 RepID=A0AB34GU48_ESCRO|nr:hypothetical protein J1605_008676 [Eschrichtius robustus]
MGSSQTRARTRVPCIGRQILNHCATREACYIDSYSSRHAGSVVVAHGPSCSAACGIFPDQGSNPCPLHWQADSPPLRHQGSPNLLCGMWDLPRPGLEPVSPALAGGFSTTAPPGKPDIDYF